MGTPISPAFSMIEIASFAIKPMMAASRMKLEPITLSSWQATSTTSSVTPLRQSPFQPARLSSAPLSVLGLVWKMPATISPVM